jgi:hypothetical protein
MYAHVDLQLDVGPGISSRYIFCLCFLPPTLDPALCFRLSAKGLSSRDTNLAPFFSLSALYVLIYSPPRGFEGNPVLPRDGLSKEPLVRGIAPPEELSAGSCTPNPAPPPPHARGRSGTTRGSSASQPPVVFRSYPPWVVVAWPARGEFLAPNSPLGPPPVLLADFWATGRARNPLEFVRWVVPIKARGRYTLCSAIHCA